MPPRWPASRPPDTYEARTVLLTRTRQAYLRLAEAPTWRTFDATGGRESVWSAALATVQAYAAQL